ncbi:MAG: MMPL family transporter [Pyrobaculum sp.]
MKKYIAAAFVVLASFIYLALYSNQVFNYLVYDEGELMPPNSELKLVEKIISSNSTNLKEVPVLIYGPGVEAKARLLSSLYPDSITPWSILDKAIDLYQKRLEEIVDNYTSIFINTTTLIVDETSRLCKELERLVEAYREAKRYAEFLILATYGIAASGSAIDNKTERFLTLYRQYLEQYDIDTAVRKAADIAYGNVSRFLKNVNWRNWASVSTVEKIVEEILLDKLNKTLIDLAREVDKLGVEQYMYISILNKTPPGLRPYLPYLVCGGDVQKVAAIFRAELLKNITSRFPPPNLYTLQEAAMFVRNNTYVLALVRSENTPAVPRDIGIAVSTEALLKSFTEVVTEDVSKIDKATALAMFVVLLYVMGTLLTPLLIISTVGLTYLSTLGFFYQIHSIQPIYYLVVYMSAPVIFAIGVDYMLLMASRYAEERARGLSRDEAVKSVRAYANRAIAASAAVVATALGSFALSHLPFMQSIGVGYLITTAFIAAAVFFIFPMYLTLLGDRVFWPKKTLATHGGRSRMLEKAVDTALRKPLIIVIASALVTLVSFLFLLTTLQITANPVVAMPETEEKKALEILSKYFADISAISKTYVVMKSEPSTSLLNEIEKLPHFVNYTVYNRGEWHVVEIKLSVEDTSDALQDVYKRLDELRAEFGEFLIGGAAAWKHIIFEEIYVKFWNFQVFVVILAVYLILMFLLKSFIIPARLLITVFMSISWSLALEVLIFQEIMATPTYWLVPIILFSFLLAIGTDYDIFIVARIKEELEKGLDEKEAIRRAIVSTGPVITGAAIILAVAFSTLLTSQLSLLQQAGFTIAIAALIDAFIIRPLVVPAFMVVAGRYNWFWFDNILKNK